MERTGTRSMCRIWIKLSNIFICFYLIKSYIINCRTMLLPILEISISIKWPNLFYHYSTNFFTDTFSIYGVWQGLILVFLTSFWECYQMLRITILPYHTDVWNSDEKLAIIPRKMATFEYRFKIKYLELFFELAFRFLRVMYFVMLLIGTKNILESYS